VGPSSCGMWDTASTWPNELCSSIAFNSLCSFLGNGVSTRSKMASRPKEPRCLASVLGLGAPRNGSSSPHAPPLLPGLTGLSFSNSMAVRRAAQQYGLREGAENEDWTLCWTDYSVSLEQVTEMKSYQPFIIDGFKFDLRIYVLMTSCDPLRIFAYNEGLARFATTSYSLPCTDNLDDVCMHLTNYSINKHSSNFIRDAHSGSKR
uniref:Tubulin tyrosine ligase like 6 n=1 Tax=Equus caballus TaxID=9796 RepID=A0A9L0T6M1_HORSE